MALLNLNDVSALQHHCNDLANAFLSGILVGQGSMIWHFSKDTSILVQCPFAITEGTIVKTGNGEESGTSIILFQFLNNVVRDVVVQERGLLILKFDRGRNVQIIPDNAGYESYVVSTANGVFPVF